MLKCLLHDLVGWWSTRVEGIVNIFTTSLLSDRVTWLHAWLDLQRLFFREPSKILVTFDLFFSDVLY